ncbi:hypothetical protein KJ853_04165 [Patescibacteria group bacterium]|nr:hypothetical protein [Patescibacteria group bacterium]
MDKEQVQKKIKEVLEKMGCTDVIFKDAESDSFFVAFNSKEVTSFIADVGNWKYSGIQLDVSRERQYKIDFKKVS